MPSSQAVGSQRRGSVLSAHCSWALFSAAAEAKVSAGALYSDIKSAYYLVIWQYVVGFPGPEMQLRACLHRLGLSPEVSAAAVEFVIIHGSLLQLGQADPALVEYMRSLNEDAWFVIDGSDSVARTTRGARAGEATADLFFIFLFGRVTKEVRTIINASPFGTELSLRSTGFLASLDGFDSTTDDAEVVSADDVMHASTHKDVGFVVEMSDLLPLRLSRSLAAMVSLSTLSPAKLRPCSHCEAQAPKRFAKQSPATAVFLSERLVACRLRIQTPWHLGHPYWLPNTGCCKKSRSRQGSVCQVLWQVSFVGALRCQAQDPRYWGCC